MHMKEKFKKRLVSDQIIKYYKVNEIKRFSFSRPLRKPPKNSKDDNEYASLWIERTYLDTNYPLPGIQRLFPVIKCTCIELSPIETAVESLENTNSDMKDLILKHLRDPNAPLQSLQMKLMGVIDAAVNGGISNYEKAFFTQKYLEENFTRRDLENVERLRELISLQVPLLELGVSIHKEKVPTELRPMHDHMETQFSKLRVTLENDYGRRTLPLEILEAKNQKVIPKNETLSSNDLKE